MAAPVAKQTYQKKGSSLLPPFHLTINTNNMIGFLR